jgi:hypothetical protein
MRYVMRIARSASHQNFERSLHFLVECVCWSVCGSPTLELASKSRLCVFTHVKSSDVCYFGNRVLCGNVCCPHPRTKSTNLTTCSECGDASDVSELQCCVWRYNRLSDQLRIHVISTLLTITHRTSNQIRLPAEFKHITKRRKRN